MQEAVAVTENRRVLPSMQTLERFARLCANLDGFCLLGLGCI
jgi:hypothetical protein